MPNMTVVDCTLRDGGFHNAWDFAPALVHAYLRAVDLAGVDWAEVGYRSLERDGFAGALRYCDEDTLLSLPVTRTTRLGVMVDARELVGGEDAIGRLFRPASDSRVGLVRVATRPRDLASALAQLERLHALGYTTGLNIMAWASVPADERPALLARIAAFPAVDVFYVADSYGSLYPDDVRALAELVASVAPDRSRPWGIHLHDNLELAFANALAARAAGATWIDASVLGMGRGPGNLKTELWIQHLETRERTARYHVGPLYELIGRHWEALRERYRWGSSAPYVLSGQLAVHPSYAQELLESQRYTVDEVAAMLQALHAAGHGKSFSRMALEDAMSARPTPLTRVVTTARHDRPRAATASPTSGLSGWRGTDWSEREVLVVGRGASAKTHAGAINRYIRMARPIVIECNHLPEIAASEDHLAAFIVTANIAAMGADALESGKALLLGTTSGRPSETPPLDADGAIYTEPYRLQSGTLATTPCTIPSDVVSMFAIAQALRFNARRLTVVGFDGYGHSHVSREKRMQEELLEFLGLLAAKFPEAELISLTPTTFPIKVRSIYGALALAEPA